MARSTPAVVNKPFDRPRDPVRPCQHPGCQDEGAHRAPAARNRLDEYVWFCLEHIRAYNKAWDFFLGMSEAEIELQRRSDTVWQRPSWPLGQFGEHAVFGADYRLRDGFEFFSQQTASAQKSTPLTEEQKALALLDLKEPVTFQDVKVRYKELVKKLHPDANGGDTEAEERLKIINQAYGSLKISFA